MKSSIQHSLFLVLFSLFFTACEVGITPLEQEFNEAGVATSGVLTEEGDIGTITVEVQEGVNIEDLNVSIEIFGEGSEHFTVELDKSAAAYIGEITVKPDFIVYKDTPFTFFARTIVNGQKLCAKEVQKTVLRTEVAPVARNQTVDLNGSSVTFSLDASDKNDDVLTYESKTNPQYGTYKVNDDNSITYTLNSAEQTPLVDTFTYVAKDERSQSNEATVTINITNQSVDDTREPTITLLGDNPVNLTVGTAYADAGATANDNVNGDISHEISIRYLYEHDGSTLHVGEINTSKVGTYTIYYDVNDTAGNAATQVTRTVKVNSNEISFSLFDGNATAIFENGEIYDLQLIDMDKDGDLDIFVNGKHENNRFIGWLNKSGNTYERINIDINDTSEIQAVHVADINDDGYTDVLYGKESLHYCLNVGGDTFTCSEDTLDGDDYNITDIKVVDMDNDDYVDILFSDYISDKVYWVSQFSSEALTHQVLNPGGVGSFDIGDIDGDNDIDIITEGSDYGIIRYYNEGSFPFQFAVSNNAPARTITLADFDDSGFMEYVIWTETDGIFTTILGSGDPVNVDTNITSPTKPSAVDIDGDGGIDILSSSSEENGKIVWYKNTGTGFSTSITIADINNSTVVQAGEMDGDGDVDVVAGDKDGNIFVYFNSLN